MSYASVIIQVDPTTLGQSRMGGVTGLIYLKVGGNSFPDSGWDDFPVTILAWWLRDTLSLFQNKASSVQCSFMDGPYSFGLRSVEGKCYLDLIARSSSEESVLSTHHIDPKQLLDSQLSAAKALLAECRARLWDSRDLFSLLEAVRNTERAVAA